MNSQVLLSLECLESLFKDPILIQSSQWTLGKKQIIIGLLIEDAQPVPDWP